MQALGSGVARHAARQRFRFESLQFAQQHRMIRNRDRAALEGWAATVLAQFAQAAYLLRNSLPIGTAFTWTDVSTLSRPSLDSVRSEINDLIDKFLHEWLKQNPRR